MFTWCKRSIDDDKISGFPLAYSMAKRPAIPPTICASLPQPHVGNRGVPSALIDLESRMRGRDRRQQPACNDPCTDVATNYFMERRGVEWRGTVPGRQPSLVHEAMRQEPRSVPPQWRQPQRSSSFADTCATVESRIRI